MKPKKQDHDSGPHPEDKSKLSLAASKPTKSANLNGREPGDEQQEKLQTPKPMKIQTKESENEQDSGLGTTPKKQRKPKSLMPVPKAPPTEKRADQALRRLKVKPEALSAAPPITPLLKNTIEGGLKTAMDAMRFATDDPEIRAFLKIYDKIPIGDRAKLSWEAITIAAKVNPKHLLGAIQLAVQTHCLNRSRFIVISNHPDTTQKRVEFAKLAGGEKDRTQLDIMAGMLPSPKGNTFIGRQTAVYNAGGGVQPGSDKGDDENIVSTIDPNSEIEDRLFGSDDLDGKLVKIRQRLLEG